MARNPQPPAPIVVNTNLLNLPPTAASKVAKPSAGALVLFVDKADNILKAKKSDGTLVQIKNKMYYFNLQQEVLEVAGEGFDPAEK